MTMKVPLLLAAILAILPFQGATAQSLQTNALQTNAQVVQNDSPDPVAIARHCVRRINFHADRASGAIAGATDATLMRIRRLHAAGASDREIIAAGQAGAGRVARIGAGATDSMQSATRRCVAAMIAAGADRRLVARVIGASADAQDRVAGAVQRAQTTIRAAVAAATR